MDIELLVESTERHRMRLAEGGSFYSEINNRGLNLLMNSPQKTSETNPEDWYAAYPGNDVSSVGQNYDQLRTGVERLRTKIGRRDA